MFKPLTRLGTLIGAKGHSFQATRCHSRRFVSIDICSFRLRVASAPICDVFSLISPTPQHTKRLLKIVRRRRFKFHPLASGRVVDRQTMSVEGLTFEQDPLACLFLPSRIL